MSAATSDRLLVLEAIPPRLLALSLDGKQLDVLIDDLGGTPDGITVDYKHRHIYWTNMGKDWSRNDGFIERVDFDGSHRTVIIPEGSTFTPKQLQVNADAGLLYWCDREGMRVMRSRLDGSDITILVQTGATEAERADERRHCVGIAIDRANGRLYWTQKGPPNGGQGRILSAPLDLPKGMSPSSRTDIRVVFDQLPEPIDLEWDEQSNTLYWTDRGDPPQGNTLNRSRFAQGEPGKPEILLGGLQEGIGLALDRASNQAFVSDLGGNIRVVALSDAASPRVIRSGLGALTGIALWQPASA
jgi:DNA-binding beta-propeller fold protein YncE